MKFWRNLLNSLNIGILLSGLTILFVWTGGTPKILGFSLVTISLIIIFINNFNDKGKNIPSKISIVNVVLGLILIVIDLFYNLYTGGKFGYFDFGMIFSGIFIILLHINTLNFLRLDEKMKNFITIFIFIIMIFFGFFSSGIEFIYKSIYGLDGNPIYLAMTYLAVKNSAFLLNFMKPTTVANFTVNFDGFSVSIFSPCSGVESITIFISAALAYFIAFKEKNIKKNMLILIIAMISLYFMNILRIMIIVVIGHDYGIDEMLFVHYHLGWIMFAMGMSVFWYLVFKDK